VSAEPIAVPPASCPLCASPAPADAGRCPDCGYDLAGVGTRPRPFSRRVLIFTAIGFLLIYVATLAIVAVTK
jgi:hypothetical protein